MLSKLLQLIRGEEKTMNEKEIEEIQKEVDEELKAAKEDKVAKPYGAFAGFEDLCDSICDVFRPLDAWMYLTPDEGPPFMVMKFNWVKDARDWEDYIINRKKMGLMKNIEVCRSMSDAVIIDNTLTDVEV
jgi:hypothetical protein